jgi:hypothetical protein
MRKIALLVVIITNTEESVVSALKKELKEVEIL